MPDPLRPQFLWPGRERQDRIDLPLGEERHGLGEGMDDPVDVLAWVHAHIGQNAGEEHVIGATQLGDGDGLPLQIANRADVVGPKQLEAADVGPREDDEGVSSLQAGEKWSGEVQCDVNLPSAHGLREQFLPRPDVLHVREPLARQ
jgi:hypothetical protein